MSFALSADYRHLDAALVKGAPVELVEVRRVDELRLAMVAFISASIKPGVRLHRWVAAADVVAETPVAS